MSETAVSIMQRERDRYYQEITARQAFEYMQAIRDITARREVANAMAQRFFIAGGIGFEPKMEGHMERIKVTPSVKEQYTPERILKSGNRTIVFWGDGEKTIVKKAEDEEDNVYAAFTAALAIKVFGSNAKLQRMIKKKLGEQSCKIRYENDVAYRRCPFCGSKQSPLERYCTDCGAKLIAD